MQCPQFTKSNNKLEGIQDKTERITDNIKKKKREKNGMPAN